MFLEGLIRWNINPVNVKIYFLENRITRFYRSSTGSKNGDMYGNYGLIDGYRHFKVARNMLANGKEGCILHDFPNRRTATYPFESLQPLSDRNPSLVWFLMTAVRIFVCDKSSRATASLLRRFMNEREILPVCMKTGANWEIYRVDGHKTFICSDNTLNKHDHSVNLLTRYLAVAWLQLSITVDSIIRQILSSISLLSSAR